jgi:hypothetical protein
MIRSIKINIYISLIMVKFIKVNIRSIKNNIYISLIIIKFIKNNIYISLFVTLPRRGYVCHIAMTGLCLTHCDIAMFIRL